MANPTTFHKALLGCGIVAAAIYAVTDLTASAAASRAVLLPLLFATTAFGLAFASGVRHAADDAIGTRRTALRICAGLVFALAVIHVSAPATITWLVALATMACAAVAFTDWFRLWSIIAFLFVAEFGAIAAAGASGANRIALYAYLAWSALFAGALAQKHAASAGSASRTATGVSTW